MATHVDVSDKGLMFRFEDGVWQAMYCWDKSDHPDDVNLWVKIDHRYGPCNGAPERKVSMNFLAAISEMEVIAMAVRGS